MRKRLSEPYASLNPLPFNPHGWYRNQRQIERLFAIHKIMTVVEIGSWLGLSTRHLAKLLPEGGKLFAVDHWLGSKEHQSSPYLEKAYEQFLSNMIHAGLTERVVPVRMDSVEAAKALMCHPDLIYIDGSHEYEDLIADLTAWYPNGGIVCGDDWDWLTVRQAVLCYAEENSLCISCEQSFWRLFT